MTGYHIGLKIANALICNDRMQENRRLCNLRLFQIFFASIEHDVGYPEFQDLIRLFEKLFSKNTVFVVVLAHAGKLGPLTRKNKCMLHDGGLINKKGLIVSNL